MWEMGRKTLSLAECERDSSKTLSGDALLFIYDSRLSSTEHAPHVRRKKTSSRLPRANPLRFWYFRAVSFALVLCFGKFFWSFSLCLAFFFYIFLINIAYTPWKVLFYIIFDSHSRSFGHYSCVNKTYFVVCSRLFWCFRLAIESRGSGSLVLVYYDVMCMFFRTQYVIFFVFKRNYRHLSWDDGRLIGELRHSSMLRLSLITEYDFFFFKKRIRLLLL